MVIRGIGFMLSVRALLLFTVFLSSCRPEDRDRKPVEYYEHLAFQGILQDALLDAKPESVKKVLANCAGRVFPAMDFLLLFEELDCCEEGVMDVLSSDYGLSKNGHGQLQDRGGKLYTVEVSLYADKSTSWKGWTSYEMAIVSRPPSSSTAQLSSEAESRRIGSVVISVSEQRFEVRRGWVKNGSD